MSKKRKHKAKVEKAPLPKPSAIRAAAESAMASTIDRVLTGMGYSLRGRRSKRKELIAKAGDTAVESAGLTPQDEVKERMESRPVPTTLNAPHDFGTGPTPQRKAMADDEIEPSEDGKTIRFLDGSVLDSLFSRKNIDGDQYNSGRQFYMDWYNSGLSASGVIDLDRPIVDGSGKLNTSDIMHDAMKAHEAAKAHVGPVHYRVLEALLLKEEGLEPFGRRRFGYGTRRDAVTAAIAVLRLALEHLVDHYFKRRRPQTMSAHAYGYRPEPSPEAGEQRKDRRTTVRTVEV